MVDSTLPKSGVPSTGIHRVLDVEAIRHELSWQIGVRAREVALFDYRTFLWETGRLLGGCEEERSILKLPCPTVSQLRSVLYAESER
jgi:hypothetical protein